MTCPKFSECVKAEHCLLKDNKCMEVKEESIVSCKEKGKIYLLHTEGVKTLKYHIDGHVIKNAVNGVDSGCPKCDNLCLVKGNYGKAVFVELKGSEVEHAFKQLETSISMLQFALENNYTSYARVICSKYPKCYGSDSKEKLNKKLQRLNGVKTGMFVVVNAKNQLEEYLKNL